MAVAVVLDDVESVEEVLDDSLVLDVSFVEVDVSELPLLEELLVEAPDLASVRLSVR